MKPKIICSLFITLVCLIESQILNCQDKIIKLDGSELKCKIVSIDSVKIDMKVEMGANEILTFINLDNVSSYTWQGNKVVLRPLNAGTVKNIKKSPDSPPAVNSPEFLFADSVEKTNRNFVYTFSDQIIKAHTIEFKEPFLGTSYLLIDSKKMDLNEVKFYRNYEGFFANTSYLSAFGTNSFSERIVAGRVNLYETFKVSSYPGNFNPSTGMYMNGGFSAKISNYYNKGFSDLKKANYRNLSVDLADDPLSMSHIEKCKSINNTEITIAVIGGTLILGGFVAFINSTDKDADTNNIPAGAITAIGLGTAACWVSFFISLSKPKHLRQAIVTYNRK